MIRQAKDEVLQALTKAGVTLAVLHFSESGDTFETQPEEASEEDSIYDLVTHFCDELVRYTGHTGEIEGDVTLIPTDNKVSWRIDVYYTAFNTFTGEL